VGHVIEAIIFDIDGLMIDSERVSQRSWRLVMAEAGYDLTDAIYREMIGRTEKDVKGILLGAFGARFPFEEIYRRREERFLQIIAEEGIPRKPGLMDVLGWVKVHALKYAVASSTYCRLAESKLVAAGIRDQFTVIVTGDEVTHGKPAPDLFLAAAGRIQVAPAACVVLEDSQAGIQAAHAAGMASILVPDMQTVDPAVQALAYRVLSSLEQAPAVLEELLHA
jgi:HAD superfamily hydrolase (TIGR01509 family)